MINGYGYSYTTTGGETIIVQNRIKDVSQKTSCSGGFSYRNGLCSNYIMTECKKCEKHWFNGIGLEMCDNDWNCPKKKEMTQSEDFK